MHGMKKCDTYYTVQTCATHHLYSGKEVSSYIKYINNKMKKTFAGKIKDRIS